MKTIMMLAAVLAIGWSGAAFAQAGGGGGGVPAGVARDDAIAGSPGSTAARNTGAATQTARSTRHSARRAHAARRTHHTQPANAAANPGETTNSNASGGTR